MTDQTHPVTYFLGANSARGFPSLYEQWIDQEEARAFYVIKGGAGCGKSTLMAGVARQMEAAAPGTRTPWTASPSPPRAPR